jgi:aerobic-type carbon monoxide dehydrogenase small subunit (CoxS/CutS family)
MKIEIRTMINGRDLDVAVKSNQTLLEFLRDDLRLRGGGNTTSYTVTRSGSER